MKIILALAGLLTSINSASAVLARDYTDDRFEADINCMYKSGSGEYDRECDDLNQLDVNDVGADNCYVDLQLSFLYTNLKGFKLEMNTESSINGIKLQGPAMEGNQNYELEFVTNANNVQKFLWDESREYEQTIEVTVNQCKGPIRPSINLVPVRVETRQTYYLMKSYIRPFCRVSAEATCDVVDDDGEESPCHRFGDSGCGEIDVVYRAKSCNNMKNKSVFIKDRALARYANQFVDIDRSDLGPEECRVERFDASVDTCATGKIPFFEMRLKGGVLKSGITEFQECQAYGFHGNVIIGEEPGNGGGGDLPEPAPPAPAPGPVPDKDKDECKGDKDKEPKDPEDKETKDPEDKDKAPNAPTPAKSTKAPSTKGPTKAPSSKSTKAPSTKGPTKAPSAKTTKAPSSTPAPKGPTKAPKEEDEKGEDGKDEDKEKEKDEQIAKSASESFTYRSPGTRRKRRLH